MTQLPAIVQALLNPKVYLDTPQRVELVQTQMSFVFLTPDYVYKIKKPVNLGYLDYTTLDKRQFYCQREVELNRRLCPDAYLGVVPVNRYKDNIAVEGQGEVIEYAVKMRRLPKEAMMDVLLPDNRVSSQMLGRVAQKLAEFHQKAETGTEINVFGNLDTITQNTEENFVQTEQYIGTTISQGKYQHIKNYTDIFIKNGSTLFRKRVDDGRVKE